MATAEPSLSPSDVIALLSCLNTFEFKATGQAENLAKLRLLNYLDASNGLTTKGHERMETLLGNKGKSCGIAEVRREIIDWYIKRYKLLGCKVEEKTEEKSIVITVKEPGYGGILQFSIPLPLFSNDSNDAIKTFISNEALLIQKLKKQSQ